MYLHSDWLKCDLQSDNSHGDAAEMGLDATFVCFVSHAIQLWFRFVMSVCYMEREGNSTVLPLRISNLSYQPLL